MTNEILQWCAIAFVFFIVCGICKIQVADRKLCDASFKIIEDELEGL